MSRPSHPSRPARAALAAVLSVLAACAPDPANPGEAAVEALVSALEAAAPGLVVEPAAVAAVAAGGQGDFLVYLGGRPDLSAAYGMDWKARGRYVAERLQQAADEAQRPVRQRLDARGTAYRAFWIDNVLAVKGSDLETLVAVASVPGVTALRAPRMLGLVEPDDRAAATLSPAAVESNLDHVRAPSVWAQRLRGEGMVVANIDTGVRYTHETLAGHYRGANGDGTFSHDYNWWDPYAGLAAPEDDHGHGTHTMGTMVGEDATGTNRIGIAPGATWIACRGCTTAGCGETQLLDCAQWVVAPWDAARQAPDPDRRPHVVNNSWGDCGTAYDGWYQGVIDAWHAAGVYPVFSNGNASNCGYASPPGCGTVGNPARYGNVTGVGSTGTANGVYATHSNWGPTDAADTVNPRGQATLKPQVVAPGVAIRSSLAGSDTAYEAWSGTSMSSPHVSGLVALMWQAAPCLVGEYALTETLLERTARPLPYASACGGEGAGSIPNMATGWGEIDALAAVEQALAWCGPSGTVRGTVRDTSGRPIAGALLAAGGRAGRSGADGTYVLTYVPAGDQVVVATHFWHLDASVPVVVGDDQVTEQDVVMTPRPSVPSGGLVRDGSGHAWPLYARLTISEPDGTTLTTFTDPFTGRWDADLVVGATFTFRVEALLPGYETRIESVTADAEGHLRDFTLVTPFCEAPGYQRPRLLTADFESDGGGFWVAGTAGWEWGKPAAGPGQAHGGIGAWGTGLASGYRDSADTQLVSPSLDLSQYADTSFELRWWQYLVTESCCDTAWVEASRDGGATWTVLYGPARGNVDLGWTLRSVALDETWAAADVRFRFRLVSDGSVTGPGWFVDDITLDRTDCVLHPGGLVAGLVSDARTGDGIVDARVSVDDGVPEASVATPDDPAVPDGLYAVFAAGPASSVAARKFGFGDGVAQVEVTPDALTRQDLSLGEAVPVTVSGTVRDGAGHGWPMYARVTFLPPDGSAPRVAWTDPWTGRYEAHLFEGHPYPVTVEAMLPGYEVLSTSVLPGPGSQGTTDLWLDTPECTAQGYTQPVLYKQDFEAGTGSGWTAQGTTSWARAWVGTSATHSGAWAWRSNPPGNYAPDQDGSALSPVLDLSASAGHPVRLSWRQGLSTEATYDLARVEASRDGGETWATVWGPRSGSVATAWTEASVTLPADYAVSTFRVRFRLTSDSSIESTGWFVDDVTLVQQTCRTSPAAVLAGFVRGALTGEGIVGARLTLPGETEAASFATPDDDALPDGLYVAVVPPGDGQAAARTFGYGTAVMPVTTLADQANRADIEMGPVVPVLGGGLVRDVGDHRWPLYARLTLTPPDDSPPRTLFTDPFSGTWQALLQEGYTYQITAEPVLSGYAPVSADVLVDGPGWSRDFDVESPSCDAPGYTRRVFLQSGFEGDDGGFTVDGSGSWQRGVPTSGPGAAQGGSEAWATSLAGNYVAGEDARLQSPVVDLTTAGGDLRLSWWHYLATYPGSGLATVDASVDGGATWTTVWGPKSGQFARKWTRVDLVLDAGWAVPAFRARFRLLAGAGATDDGWYVDDVVLETAACRALPGGMASGFASDANTGDGLPGVRVDAGAGTMGTVATGDDPAWPDGYYAVFGDLGGRTVTGTLDGFVADYAEVMLDADRVRRVDLSLTAARLDLAPADVELQVLAGQAARAVIRLDNTGSGTAAWTLLEVPGGEPPADVPWLQASPASGALAAGSGRDLVLDVDAAVAGPGLHRARLLALGDPVPYAAPEVRVAVDVGHAVAVVPPVHGAVSPEGMAFVRHGEDASFAFQADPGYHVHRVRVDGVDQGRADGWVFPVVGESHVLEVVFEPTCLADADCPVEGSECHGVCVVDTCDPLAPRPSGTPCGDRATTACTDPDTCDGSGACESNHVGAGTTCRAAAGDCDLPESCDGLTGDCPGDAKSTAGCRAAAGDCDLPESCDGVADECPEDRKATSRCRSAAGDCDLPESCDGVADECPADRKSTDACRAAAGPCDVPESCDGVADLCPADVLAGDGAPCDDGDPCTLGDSCTGGGACGGTARACDGLPPRPSCDDAFTSRLWAPGARCDGATGDCAFDASVRTCTGGCVADTGLCAEDGDPGCDVGDPACLLEGWPVWNPAEGAPACLRQWAEDGAACDDGDPCTDGDRCDGDGACAGEPVPGCPPEPVPEPVPEAAPDAVEPLPDVAEPDLPRDVPEEATGDHGTDSGNPADDGVPDPGTDVPADLPGADATDVAPDRVADDTAAAADLPGPDPADDPAPDLSPADAGPDENPADAPPPDAVDARSDLPTPDTRSGGTGGGCASGPRAPGALPGLLLLAALGWVIRRFRRA